MNELAKHILIVIVPLVISNSVHMLVVRKNAFAITNVSVWDWGFGRNKTWRGFLFVPVTNAIVLTVLSFLNQLHLEMPSLLGFLLGLAYMIFELPNSFMKRRLGLPPGDNRGKFSLAFSIIDKADSAIGVVLTYLLLGNASWQMGLWLLSLSIMTHIVVSGLLVAFGMKSSF
jgi:hypothetical protein